MSLINKFFGFDESKKPPQEEAPAPAPAPRKLLADNIPIEKGVETQSGIHNESLKAMRLGAMHRTFGTSDLDYILHAYAPDTIDTLQCVLDQANACVGQNNETHENQKKIYNWTKELILKQQEDIDDLKTMMKAMMNHMNVAVPEKKPPQEGIAR